MDDIEEGSPCPIGCGGMLEVAQGENCSCHISPPCLSCIDTGLVCDECGWRLGDEVPE